MLEWPAPPGFFTEDPVEFIENAIDKLMAAFFRIAVAFILAVVLVGQF